MADFENGPKNKGGDGISGGLPPFTPSETAKFEASFRNLLLGFREAREEYAKSTGLDVDSEEARTHGWRNLVRSTEKARDALRVAAARAEGKDLERILGDILFDYVTHSEWREAHLFLRQFVPKELTGVVKNERLQRAAAYFAVDAVMSGETAFAGTFVEAMRRINSSFFDSKEYAAALREGAEAIIGAGRISDLQDFLHKLPALSDANSSRLPALERAVTAALPERLPDLGKLARAFKLKEYLAGPEFQKRLELNLEQYLASRDIGKVLKLRDSYGGLVLNETKARLQPESEALVRWQIARIEYLRGETYADSSEKNSKVAHELARLAAAEDFLFPGPRGAGTGIAR